MLKDKFQQRKKDILFKIDKSFKKKWDKRILRLCTGINSSNNYYTTSSCSGRAVLMLDKDKKQEGLFVKTYHDKISFEQLKKDLIKIASLRSDINKKLLMKNICVSGISAKNRGEARFGVINKQANFSERGSIIKFKMEPCILHVACKSLEDAQVLYDKAKLDGWKKSGIIATKNNVMLELNSTEKLEFPIIQNKRILVDDEFLKIVVEETNKKLEKSWEKIERLENSLK